MIKYGIYCAFDEGTTYKLKDFRDRVYVKVLGIPCPPNKMDPHITLQIFDSDNLTDILKIFNNCNLSNFSSFDLLLNKVATFSTRGKVIYVEPDILPCLHEIKKLIENAFSPLIVATNSYLLPWVPHCTIIKRMNSRLFIKAEKLTKKEWKPMLARIDKIELIDIKKPLQVLAAKSLNC